MTNAEITNVHRDGEAPKENPSSSTHPASVTHKVRLPMCIPVVLSLVGLDKEEKAIESCTVSCKRTTSSQISENLDEGIVANAKAQYSKVPRAEEVIVGIY